MVSGLAMRATCCRPLRPKRLPISARVARSPSESRQPGCRRAFKMRFSAARYSFCSRSSWLTSPVTQAKSSAHVVVFVFNVHHRKPWPLTAFEYFDHSFSADYSGNERDVRLFHLAEPGD